MHGIGQHFKTLPILITIIGHTILHTQVVWPFFSHGGPMFKILLRATFQLFAIGWYVFFNILTMWWMWKFWHQHNYELVLLSLIANILSDLYVHFKGAGKCWGDI